jgi:hypothetical protein
LSDCKHPREALQTKFDDGERAIVYCLACKQILTDEDARDAIDRAKLPDPLTRPELTEIASCLVYLASVAEGFGLGALGEMPAPERMRELTAKVLAEREQRAA